MTSRVGTSSSDRSAVPTGLRGLRARVRATRVGEIVWRVVVTIAGVAVIAVGIVLLPLPGPGWLIIFAGLGLLGTEYTWAARLLAWLRNLVLRWTRWAKSRGTFLRALLVFVSLVFLTAVAVGCWYLYKLM